MTVTGGLVALVYGIVRWPSPAGLAPVVGFLALAAVLLGSFVLIERRSVEPLVRLSIFSVRTVRGANVAMFVVAAGMFAMFFFNTLYVQKVLGWSPLESGSPSCRSPPGSSWGRARPAAPQDARRPEVPVIGSMLAAVGLLLFLRLTPESTYVADCSRESCSPRSGWGSCSSPSR